MRPLIAAALVALLYALHQDVWFWREARPLVFGALPVGLFYHAAYTVLTAVLLWALVGLVWPYHLDNPEPPSPGTVSPDAASPTALPAAPAHRGARK